MGRQLFRFRFGVYRVLTERFDLQRLLRVSVLTKLGEGQPGSDRRRRSTLAIALAGQAVLLAVAAFVMISDEVPNDPPAFDGEHAVSMESDAPRLQKEKVRDLKRRMSRPQTFQRLAVESTFESDLPAIPALPLDSFDADGLGELSLQDAESLLGQEGLGGLMGSFGGRESAAAFFGVEDSGRRIVVVVNTSASVVRKASARGVSIEGIQEEAIRLVEGLDSGTLFGVVQFSQGTQRFADYLAPGLVKNKRRAAEWIREELRGNPAVVSEDLLGHEAGLYEALKLQPDLVFLVTDGSLNRRTPKSGGGYSYPKISFEQLISFVAATCQEHGASPRIHVVGFELGDAEREGLRRFASRFGGTLREF